MTMPKSRQRRTLWLCAALLVVTAGISQNSTAPPASATPQASAAAPAPKEKDQAKASRIKEPAKNVDPTQYVGMDTCRTCHEEEFKSHQLGPHWKTSYAPHATVDKQGCEAC